MVSLPGLMAAGFARVSRLRAVTPRPTAVRGNFNDWDVYGRGWYTNYPGAWFAAGWAANAAWNAATWSTASAYVGYATAQPIYYDYGNNVTYEDNSVYVNGQDAGTSEQYYDQAAESHPAGQRRMLRRMVIGCRWACLH